MAKKKTYEKLKRTYFNSLFFKIALTVIIGCVILSVFLFSINIKMSQGIFVDVFADSQTKIFSQIEEFFYGFYADVAQISASVENNERVIEFLTSKNKSTVDEMGLIYNMQKQVNQMKIKEYDHLTLLIVGVNGKSYMYSKADTLSKQVKEMIQMPLTKKAASRSGELICEYIEKGFTDSTQNEPTIVYCRTIQKRRSKEIIGYTYLIMKEADMRKQYDYFVSGTGDIIVLNQDEEVISTNNSIYFDVSNEVLGRLGGVMQEATNAGISKVTERINGENITCLVKRFSNTNLTIVGILNPNRAFYVRYDLILNILLVAVITMIIVGVIFFLVRRQTRPIYELSNAMKNQKNGISKSFIEPNGSIEVRELTETYNEMIKHINHYIDKIKETEQAKRSAELSALQMQINPHYIYNTLASIKWLVLRENLNEAVEALEAFIELLRNTISNDDEFITVHQEIINVKNYMLINQKRYGEKISVDFYISEDCYEYTLPKLILQPFVENSFFHAFPDERRGKINVFINNIGEVLTIEISDDGVGMEREDIACMMTRPAQKEHFTGIGIKNVDERIKMIYGNEYGIKIESEKNKGTTIIIKVPIR